MEIWRGALYGAAAGAVASIALSLLEAVYYATWGWKKKMKAR